MRIAVFANYFVDIPFVCVFMCFLVVSEIKAKTVGNLMEKRDSSNVSISQELLTPK